MRIIDVGEFGLIDRLRALLGEGTPAAGAVSLGIGDDAAVLAAGEGRELVATADMLVEGVHFRRQWISAEDLGWKSLAVNVSDVGAMGAAPLCALVCLALPGDAEAEWVEALYRGLKACAEEYGCPVVGGDTVRSPGPVALSVTALGSVATGTAVRRDGAKPGDVLCVTGTLGDSAAGIALINERVDTPPGSAGAALKARFYKPAPRVDAGLALRTLASAAIDVSDGLLADLGHICERSGCGALIDVERVPLSAELLSTFPPQIALAHALGGGDDYELCFTAPPSRAEQIERALEGTGTPATRVGQLVPGQKVVCRRDGEPYEPPSSGFRHF